MSSAYDAHMPRIFNQPRPSGMSQKRRKCIASYQSSRKHNKSVSAVTANNRCNERFRAKYGVSRQRLWQLSKRLSGLCIICGEKVCKKSVTLCDTHRIAKNERRNERKKVAA